MHMGLRLCMRQELRQTLRQELRLNLKMKPPSDMAFEEPDAMKHIESVGGRKVIRITEREMASYVSAVRNVRGILEEVVPDVVLISMRGALPMFRAVVQSMNPKFLDLEDRNGADWDEKRISKQILVRAPDDKFVCSLAKTEKEKERLRWKYGDKKNISFRAVKADTSYFLADLEGSLEEGLRAAFKKGGRKRNITALFLDTSVTGTKMGWFMPQFRDAMIQIADGVKKQINMVNVILQHGRAGAEMCLPTITRSKFLTTTRVDLGVESLITEDSVTLLGSTIDRDEMADDAIGVVRADQEPEMASIMVGSRLFDIDDEVTGSTAALFSRIAGDMADNRILITES